MTEDKREKFKKGTQKERERHGVRFEVLIYSVSLELLAAAGRRTHAHTHTQSNSFTAKSNDGPAPLLSPRPIKLLAAANQKLVDMLALY